MSSRHNGLWPRRQFLSLFAGVLAAAVSGCGYRAVSGSSGQVRDESQQAQGARIVLPPQYRRLFIADVDNPTLEPLIGTRLRNGFRDEVTRRGGIEWVDRAQARGLVRLKITQFSDSARVRDVDDRTVKFQVAINAEARVLNPDDNAPLFDSGPIGLSQSYFAGERDVALERLVDLIARRLADRLADAF